MLRTTLITAIALGLLAALVMAAPVGAASTGATDASGAWLMLTGLGLIGWGAGLIVLGRRNRLGR